MYIEESPEHAVGNVLGRNETRTPFMTKNQ
jgi:hypothetical protein